MLAAAAARASRAAASAAVARAAAPRRALSIHEYQSKQLMERFGVNVQRNRVVGEGESALDAARALKLAPGREYVVKAQVHAGGRGKGSFVENGFKGGVHLVDSAESAADLAQKMIGNHLVTKQTAAEGVKVRKVMIAEALDISKEFYFALLMDRASSCPVVVASSEGGMDIEEVAETQPDKIHKTLVDINTGLSTEQAVGIARAIGVAPALEQQAAEQMAALYKLFIDTDSTQVEINPLVETPDARIVSFDAKIQFDDNAEFRQADIFALRDDGEEDPREVAARAHNLNYIGMDGNIGCMVNGAGLAMATMDIITKHGKDVNATPANFLDVGGGANEEQVTEAFKLLRADKKVEAILVNIFGGIIRCDMIAQGVVNAARAIGLDVPVVIRVAGTNVDQAHKIIAESGLNLIVAEDLDDAATKAVAAISGAQ